MSNLSRNIDDCDGERGEIAAGSEVDKKGLPLILSIEVSFLSTHSSTLRLQ